MSISLLGFPAMNTEDTSRKLPKPLRISDLSFSPDGTIGPANTSGNADLAGGGALAPLWL